MKEKAKYTNGPWSAERVNTQVGSCWKIGAFPSMSGRVNYGCVYVDGQYSEARSSVEKELEANARIMAAAPDLLESLIEMMSWHQSGMVASEDDARAAIQAIERAIGEVF